MQFEGAREIKCGANFSTGSVNTGVEGQSLFACIRRQGDANHNHIDTEAWVLCKDNANGVTPHSLGGDGTSTSWAHDGTQWTHSGGNGNWTNRWFCIEIAS